MYYDNYNNTNNATNNNNDTIIVDTKWIQEHMPCVLHFRMCGKLCLGWLVGLGWMQPPMW